MDAAHLHLLLNHFPIIGTLLGTLVLVYGFIRKNESIKVLSSIIISIMALLAIPVFLTGEPAEEVVEGIAGVTEMAIEAHEEAAELALVVMLITGGIGILSLILHFMKHRLFSTGMIVLLLGGLLSFALMARVGYLGGQIRHTELSGVAGGSGTEQQLPQSGEDDD